MAGGSDQESLAIRESGGSGAFRLPRSFCFLQRRTHVVDVLVRSRPDRAADFYNKMRRLF